MVRALIKCSRCKMNGHNILTCALPSSPNEKRRDRSNDHYEQRNQRLKTLRKEDPAFLEAERAYKRAWKAKNRERLRQQDRAWKAANPGKVKTKQLVRDFGITLDDYKQLLDKQGGACAICKALKPGGKSKHYFNVDHNHQTKEIRGLLCFNCNRGLGNFKDSVKVLLCAIAYLESPKSGTRLFAKCNRKSYPRTGR